MQHLVNVSESPDLSGKKSANVCVRVCVCACVRRCARMCVRVCSQACVRVRAIAIVRETEREREKIPTKIFLQILRHF